MENYEMIVVANDFHIPFHDKKAIELLKLFLKKEQPQKLVLNGDIMDCFEISRFDKVPINGKKLKDEIVITRQLLSEFKKICPKTEITYIFGNHEFRLRQYIIKNAKELYGLDGLNIADQLHLKELGIKYIEPKEYSNKFTDTFIKIGDLYIGHWDKVNKHSGYSAKNLLEDKGVSLIQGHTHRGGVSYKSLVDGKVIKAIENFCLCSLNPSYVSHPNWQQGFCVIYHKLGKGRFHAYPIDIVEYKFFWGDKEFYLEVNNS